MAWSGEKNPQKTQSDLNLFPMRTHFHIFPPLIENSRQTNWKTLIKFQENPSDQHNNHESLGTFLTLLLHPSSRIPLSGCFKHEAVKCSCFGIFLKLFATANISDRFV